MCVCVCVEPTFSPQIGGEEDGWSQDSGFREVSLLGENALASSVIRAVVSVEFQCILFFFFFSFLGLHLWHVGVSRLGVELEV